MDRLSCDISFEWPKQNRQNRKKNFQAKMPATIISDYNDHPPINDVIYVVEDSVNLSAFFDDLLSTYLVKALEHFNGGSHTSVERAWASIECSTTFTLVLVKSTDFRPDLITTFRGPFTSAKRFFNALENISFVGKKSQNLQIGYDFPKNGAKNSCKCCDFACFSR